MVRKTPEERGIFNGRMKTRSGHLVRVTIDRKPDGTWKIFSVGSVNGITGFLPDSIFQLVKQPPHATLDDAKWAVKSA
jgi:hypothetical protein